MATLVDEALTELHAGHIERAHELFHDAVRRGDNADHAWAWIAHRHAESDDWRAALNATSQAVRVGEPPWWTHHIHGVALTRLGRAAEAEMFLQRAALAAPDSLDVAIAQARASIAAGDTAGATRAVIRARQIDAASARTRRTSALLAMSEERWPEAEAELRGLLQEGGEIDVEALTNLGVALAAAGHEDAAGVFFADAALHGETTQFHRLTQANLRRHRARFRQKPARRTDPDALKPGIIQFRLLLWALPLVLIAGAVHARPLLASGLLAAAAFSYTLVRRHRPRGRYQALPDYIGLRITVPDPARP